MTDPINPLATIQERLAQIDAERAKLIDERKATMLAAASKHDTAIAALDIEARAMRSALLTLSGGRKKRGA